MIIGLLGKKNSGKTTIANYLVCDHNFVEYAFAEPLKKISSIFGFTDTQLYGTQKDKATNNDDLNISAREFMQKFGTEICREILPSIIPDMDLSPFKNIWIKLMLNFVKKNSNKKICIQDIRFCNEADAVKSKQGILIKIIRKNNTDDEFSTHKSEIEIDKITPDFIIENDGTIDDMYKKIDAIIEYYYIQTGWLRMDP
jgi:hypothetical protein